MDVIRDLYGKFRLLGLNIRLSPKTPPGRKNALYLLVSASHCSGAYYEVHTEWHGIHAGEGMPATDCVSASLMLFPCCRRTPDSLPMLAIRMFMPAKYLPGDTSAAGIEPPGHHPSSRKKKNPPPGVLLPARNGVLPMRKKQLAIYTEAHPADLYFSIRCHTTKQHISQAKKHRRFITVVTLKEAFKLCRIQDHAAIYLYDDIGNIHGIGIPLIMTGKEVREKFKKNSYVTAIAPHFCCGEYKGFVFELKSDEKKGRSIKHVSK